MGRGAEGKPGSAGVAQQQQDKGFLQFGGYLEQSIVGKHKGGTSWAGP